MLVNKGDIKQTSKGWRVDKKVAGQPRLRKTFETYDEAERVLTRYMKGEGDQIAVIASKNTTTWKVLYDNAMRRKWRTAKSPTQQENAERVIELHLGWDTDVRLFDQKAADTLGEALEIPGRSLITVNKYLSAVRFMLTLGYERDLITWKLPKLDHHAQDDDGRINFFDYAEEEQVVAIMNQIARPEMACLFTLFIETGMRTSEGAYLQWRDVYLDDGIIILWGSDKSGKGTKTGKSRRVPLTDKARGVLNILLSQREMGEPRVFPIATKSYIRSTWDSVRKATGNSDPDFVWYTTRHTCASRLMRAGVDVKTIQAWLGHSRIETTMRYIQFSAGSLITAAGALNVARESKQVDTADMNASCVPGARP